MVNIYLYVRLKNIEVKKIFEKYLDTIDVHPDKILALQCFNKNIAFIFNSFNDVHLVQLLCCCLKFSAKSHFQENMFV